MLCYKIVCLIYMYAFPFAGTIFRLQVQIQFFRTPAKTDPISAWGGAAWGGGHKGQCGKHVPPDQSPYVGAHLKRYYAHFGRYPAPRPSTAQPLAAGGR